MAKTRKRVRMVVEVSCPRWLTAAQARKEVRTLINEQCHWGHENRFECVDESNFRAAAVRPAGRG